uniref:WSC domain-containing protein n=1 Tax=Macrostomum lignano TaxID=282301 RepID=A0A1I8HUF6_9PLAT
ASCEAVWCKLDMLSILTPDEWHEMFQELVTNEDNYPKGTTVDQSAEKLDECDCDRMATIGSTTAATPILVIVVVSCAAMASVLSVTLLALATLLGCSTNSDDSDDRILVLLPPGRCASLSLLYHLPGLRRQLQQNYPRANIIFRRRPTSSLATRLVANANNKVFFLLLGEEVEAWIVRLTEVEANRFRLLRIGR